MKLFRSLERLKQQLIARACGYFWLPCPLCGEMHGGQEPSGSWYQGMGRGVSTCLACANKAQELSFEALRNDPPIQHRNPDGTTTPMVFVGGSPCNATYAPLEKAAELRAKEDELRVKNTH